ncbi:CCR4-NOT transcription complex subunit 7 [Plectosphaerella plurivora]|uniref:poly(A)-specific ribonuclease n=1 Tax=Plectosphaerella plurivora TaxID=936078 RepID=A0A9P8V477_9PEZI|nr:CCR4-NOT transcription complex subunit 7 [Plectosphaerella plurivora]
MPPPLSRFPTGPNSLPYHQQQQFPSHPQNHAAPHGPPLGNNPSYLNANAQISPFAVNGNVMGVGAGLNGGFGSDTGLGSQAARMGFASAASLHPQQQHGQPQHGFGADHVAANMRGGNHNKGRIREVWKHNLHEEMAVLRDLVDKYPLIAMDTEFPGIVSRPMGGFRGKSDYHYQCLRTNVDMLKVIQIGLALFNEQGETPPARPTSTDAMDMSLGQRGAQQGPFPYAWQFNFKFSLNQDMYNEKSIESLQTAGIDFNMLERDGIDPHEFASLLIPSGLVCFDNVTWISFHGGYDFGYLTKLLVCEPLPSDEVDFDRIMKLYFPSTYDVKHLMKHAIRLHNSGLLTPNDAQTTDILHKFESKSGLENIAETLKVKRVGAAHQAGSDALITGKVFFQIRDKVFKGHIGNEHVGKVWGLGVPDGGLLMGHMMGGGGQNASQEQNSSNGQNGPSTPNTTTVGLASTPAAQSHNTNGYNTGPMTPGGNSGVFGNFTFVGNR